MKLFSKEEVVVSWKQVGEGLLTFTLGFGFIYFIVISLTIRSVCNVDEYQQIWNSYLEDVDSYDSYERYRIRFDDWREEAGSICTNYILTARDSDESNFDADKLTLTIPITFSYLFIFFLVRIYVRRWEIKARRKEIKRGIRKKEEHKDYVTRFLHMNNVPVEEVYNVAVIIRIFITFLIFSEFYAL